MPEPREHLPLNDLEFRILLVLVDGPSYGYRIVKEVEAAEGDRRRIYPANLYRRIRNLLDRKLIEECEPPASEEEEADGRPRTFFRPTALGVAVARAEAARLHELVTDARTRDLLGPA